jgi:thymidylate synthase
MIISDNFNDIYVKLIKLVYDTGEKSSPRGMLVREVIGNQFMLINPKNCLCTLSARKLNYKFAIIEKMEYVSGISRPEVLTSYNKNLSYFK